MRGEEKPVATPPAYESAAGESLDLGSVGGLLRHLRKGRGCELSTHGELALEVSPVNTVL